MADALWSIFPVWDQQFLGNMIALTVPLAEKVLRPIIVYVALVVLLRVFGKRELAQLNPFDLVVLLSLANTVQNAIIGDDTSVTGGLIGAVSLLAFNYVVVRFLFGHRRIDQFVQGTPTVLIEHGRLRTRGLARELLTEQELVSVAHRQGFSSLAEVETCVLEPTGTFFIQGKEPPTHERRHSELVDRLGALTIQVEQLRKELQAERRDRKHDGRGAGNGGA
jgi:uncharacterized membrane protein YcaP (DUF421 family)